MYDFDDTYFEDITEPTNENLLILDETLNYDEMDEVSDFNSDDNLKPRLRHYKFD